MNLIRKKDRCLVFLAPEELGPSLPAALSDVGQEKSPAVVLHLADSEDLALDDLSVLASFGNSLRERGVRFEIVATEKLRQYLSETSCDEIFSSMRDA